MLLCLAAAALAAGTLREAAAATPPGQALADRQPHLTVETGAHSAGVRRLAVALERGLVVTASDDKTARIWDLASGEVRHVLRPAIGAERIGRLYGVAAHPTADVVAVGGTTGGAAGEHRILLFSLSNGRLLRAFDAHGGDVKKLAWSRDGSVLLAAYAGDNALRAFDRSGALIHQRTLGAPAYGLAVASDGTVAVSSLDGRIALLSAKDGRIADLRAFRTATAKPVGIAFSPDAARLVAGFRVNGEAPEVYDVATGRRLLKLEQPALDEGTQLTVAWSADGRQIAVGGSGHTALRNFPVSFHDAATGRIVGQQDVARDTVLDLVAMPNGRFAYASSDGTWGVVSAERVVLGFRATIADLRVPEGLHADAGGSRVTWTSWASQETTSFDFSRRLVVAGPVDGANSPGRGMHAPKHRRHLLNNPTWRDTTWARINGHEIALEPAEVSRALAHVDRGADAILGTSHRLLRIDGDGRTLWQVRNASEVRSANLSGDDRIVITGMADGTLRWWRAADGALLLSLLATRDGRWITWTPEGYFDAGVGADRLVGWTVNRNDGPGADYFSLGRFRERFNRPDLIDRVLRTAAPVAEMGERAAIPPGFPVGPATQAPLRFPPVLGPADSGTLSPPPGRPQEGSLPLGGTSRSDKGAPMSVGQQETSVPVSIRAEGPVRLEARIDGRPVADSGIAVPAGATERTATVKLPTPPPGSLVQVLAIDRNGVSEPLGFLVGPGGGAQGAGALKPAASLDQPVAIRPADAGPAAKPGIGLSQARLFVLAIGIGDYKRPEYRLGLPAKDAGDFAQAMRQQEGRLYREVQSRTLTDEQASRSGIVAGLEWFSDSVGPGDIGMLFLAGHGINTETGRYFFLPYEGNHEQLEQTALPESAIRDTLRRMRGKALFFVDTCFGGNAVGNFTTASRELARLANDLAATENGVVVFASSSGKQLSEENDAWGNGAFTRAVLAGLSGKADLTRTGRITFKGLDFFVSEEVRKLTEGRQTPVTISPIGVPDFAIARAGPV